MNHSENALAIYKKLYFSKNETTPEETHERVARAIGKTASQVQIFREMLDKNIFRPNSPCMINAKEKKSERSYDNNLAACYVIGLDDSMDSIIEMWSLCSKIYAGGGGVGIPLSNLREKGAEISTGGEASGPITYLKVVQSISDSVKSGGKSRRAANLTSFKYNHPDILEYIKCKEDNNFSAVNISVLVPDDFMKDVASGNFDKEVKLISPTGKEKGSLTIGTIWNELVQHAWKSGDPGLLFYNESNRRNAFPSRGEIIATNPCLPGWAPVLTPSGYKYFKAIKHQYKLLDQAVSGTNFVKTHNETEVFQVTLESGIKVYMTSNHKIQTRKGDIELKQLSVGSEVKVDYISIFNKWVPFNRSEFNKGETFIKNLKAVNPAYKIASEMIDQEYSFQLGATMSIINDFGDFQKDKIVLTTSTTTVGILEFIQLILSSVGIYSQLTDADSNLEIVDLKSLLNILNNIDHNTASSIISKINDVKQKRIMDFDHLKDYQKISFIRSYTSCPVYDVQIPDFNHFVTSATVVHNCGEVTLPDFSMCNLGSLNLIKFIKEVDNKKTFDFKLFEEYIKYATIFLDNVIDTTTYPSEKFRDRMLSERPIGLGLMGLSWLFYELEIEYGSAESLELFEEICKTLTKVAAETSIELANQSHCGITIPEKDNAHFIKRLKYFGIDNEHIEMFKNSGIRNSTWTSIAPTGSIALSADTSYAFEPEFALIWTKFIQDTNETLYFINPIFEKKCQEYGVQLTDNIKHKIALNKGSCQGIDEIPINLQKIFIVAHDVGWRKKIDMQSKGQRYISLAISSTCNLPESATPIDVSEAYIYAWKKNLKGITVYRDGSLSFQPVEFGGKTSSESSENNLDSNSKLERPSIRIGKTVELQTPHGKMYLIGNFNSTNKLIEVFINFGKQGQLSTLLSEALGRVISIALQNSVPLDRIVHTMKDCGGQGFFLKLNQGSEEKSEYVESIIDAIAIILNKYFKENPTEFGDKCPECGEYSLIHSAGCRGGTCTKCGYSACQ